MLRLLMLAGVLASLGSFTRHTGCCNGTCSRKVCPAHPCLSRFDMEFFFVESSRLKCCRAASQISSSQVRAYGRYAVSILRRVSAVCVMFVADADRLPLRDNSHPAAHAHPDILGAPGLYCASVPALAANTWCPTCNYVVLQLSEPQF